MVGEELRVDATIKVAPIKAEAIAIINVLLIKAQVLTKAKLGMQASWVTPKVQMVA